MFTSKRQTTEAVILNSFGDIGRQCVPAPNWKDDFAAYQETRRLEKSAAVLLVPSDTKEL